MGEFFNSHRDYHYLSQSEIAGGKRISRHLSGPNLPPHLQSLVSDYAANRALRCRAALDHTYSRTFLDNFVVTMISKSGVQLGSREIFCQLRVAVRPFLKVPLAVISPS